MHDVILPIGVFLAVYAALTLEIINKAVAALLGVMILLVFGVVHEHEAFGLIDTETIMLLLGMMVIVAILRRSGFFTILSVKIARLTKGSPVKILLLFSVVTAVFSAFLDNVTTVLIIVPIIIELTVGMGLKPKIYVISQAIISNIGGTATLIGDPPNIIIGSKVGLTFNQFLFNLTPPVVVSFGAALLYLWWRHRDEFRPIDANLVKLFSVQLLLEKIQNDFLQIRIDRWFLIKSTGCLGLTIALFMTQTITNISPGVAAVLMAMVLFVISGADVEHVLEEVEWSTLLFFAGLFILVGVLEEKGVIEWIAHNVFLKVGSDPYAMVLMVLWVSGIASGILDNIPFTITMIPIVRLMNETGTVPGDLLWWSLALGACLGGNLTMIGASANIVTVGIAKKHGVHISFIEFMKTSLVVSLITLAISSLFLIGYLWWVL